MPTRLLLEGSDIAVLLDRVRVEHGPGARIVSAEKVRTGGFAGFFARERFEVTVEVDLSDGVSESSSEPVAGKPVPAEPTPEKPAAVGQAPASPASLLDLAAAIDAAEVAFAMPSATAATLAPAPVAEPEPGPLSTESVDFAAVLAGIARTAGAPSSPTAVPVLPPIPEPVAQAAPAFTPARPFVPAPIAPDELGKVLRSRRENQAETVRERVSDVPSENRSRPAERTRGQQPGLLARLTALGLPGGLVAELELDGPNELAAGLTRAIASVLPEPPRPPAGPGEVLAVVGDGPVALETARAIAKTLRLDPATVLLAGPSTYGSVHAARRITGPADAQRRALRLRRADVPTVVAVDAPLEEGAADWAHEVLEGLGVSAVWAVVDATRKNADVAAHLDLVGGVDALVVRATAVTADPAAPLALALERRLPTALLEGRRGDAAAWAALVSDRLTRRTV